jgi:ABC-type nitrate/sulfonate/bicarbonate transport system permease component
VRTVLAWTHSSLRTGRREVTRARRLAGGFTHHFVPPFVALGALLLTWELAVRLLDIAPYLLPPPSKVWRAFGELGGTLGNDIVATMTEAIAGLFIGALGGAALAMVLWSWSFARRALMPLMVISQTVPIVVLAPLLVLWFGLGLAPKVCVVALATFFPVVVATVQGLLETDPDRIDLLRTMGASRRAIVRHVLLPSTLPSFFSGLRIGASFAVGAAVVGEWVGATEGLGLLLTRAQRSFRVDRVFVAISIVTLFSVALYLVVDQLSRLLMPWQRRASSYGKGKR